MFTSNLCIAHWTHLQSVRRSRLAPPNSPDRNDILKPPSESLGTQPLGVPRSPPEHAPQRQPAQYLAAFWPATFSVVQKLCPLPIEWPVAYGLAIQGAIEASKPVIPPALALALVIESAVPMSKVDMSAL
ncbi:hypothetical protein ACWA7J_02390 [Leptothrix sp. BB-4]